MDWYHRYTAVLDRSLLRWGAGLALVGGALGVAMGCAAAVHTQSPAAAPLVFDGVTVVDVEHGQLVQGQRVVIVGSRIRAMGAAAAVRVPAGARVVDAQGKYLIPGLWDMHVHPQRYTDLYYPLFIANGVTGIRDAGSVVPLDTLRLWRREILAGTRVGPPRQFLSGPALDQAPCDPKNPKAGTAMAMMSKAHLCVASAADVRRVVDSLKVAGADIIKTYDLHPDGYFAVAAEARRVGLPFGGHLNYHFLPDSAAIRAAVASDSGAGILDHMDMSGDLDVFCLSGRFREPSLARCQPLAERFRRNGTWWVPTITVTVMISDQMGLPLQVFGVLIKPTTHALIARLFRFGSTFGDGRAPSLTWLRDSVGGEQTGQSAGRRSPIDTSGFLSMIRRVGLPILAGTDVSPVSPRDMLPGFTLHAELAVYAAEGLTPLEALQAATLNPAKMLHGMDSLGTVAPGKLADLVLLDADPLADITHITQIRAVVANGRYYDRAALDQLVAGAQAKVKQMLPRAPQR